MLRQIREHDLQHFLVDYLIGPALRCDFIGSRGAVDIFKLETTTGIYELHMAQSSNDNAAVDNQNAIPRLDGSRMATLDGCGAWVMFGGDNASEYYYFYKQS